jgi:deoxyhypusine synthase
VRGESEEMPASTPTCQGYDFDAHGVNLPLMMNAMMSTGFQATNLAKCVEEINRMRAWRLSDTPFKEGDDEDLRDPEVRRNIRARIFFSYTSNQISCGQREIIKFLVKHKMVDVLITTAGGVEEDFVKCFRPTYMGSFHGTKGEDLRAKGINRIGNLLVPNNNYCKFEDWFSPLLHKMHDEQETTGTFWSPSTMIHRMGLEINDESSVYYWAAKNAIPVFSPALTDGSIGDMLYFHSYKREGFVLDIAQDIRKVNDCAVKSYATGMIVLGGGLVKHHACNANLMRNGADFAVFVNTGQEFDGSDSGARPDEAKSWGKIKLGAQPVKLYAEATLVFPFIVAESFAKDFDEAKWREEHDKTRCDTIPATL